MYKDIKIKYSEEFARYTDAVLVTGDVNAYRIVLETPWELDGCNFKVTAKRADGKVVTDLGTTEGTKAICVLASGVYSVVGDLTMQLTLESVDGTVLTACEITATVAEGNGEGEQAENLTPVLDKAIERITVLEAEMRASASNLTNGDGVGSVMLKTAAGAKGENAVATGLNTQANGDNSFSANYNSKADGNGAFSANYSNAKGIYSFSANQGNANEEYSFAANRGQASGGCSFAANQGRTSGYYSFAANSGQADGYRSFAANEGTASGYSSFSANKGTANEGNDICSQCWNSIWRRLFCSKWRNGQR